MKRFYNHKTIKIEEHDSFTTFQFNIEVPTMYGLNFYESLDSKMQKYIKQLNSDKPTLIQIVGDFDVLENADEDDVIDFLATITNLFVSNLTTDKRSIREYRLGLIRYPDVAKANLSSITKMNIINYEVKFQIFQIEVIDIHDNVILSVF